MVRGALVFFQFPTSPDEAETLHPQLYQYAYSSGRPVPPQIDGSALGMELVSFRCRELKGAKHMVV